MIEKIQCQICGEEFNQIHHRHVKRHGMTIDEYKVKFPNSPINSEASHHKRSQSLMGHEVPWADKISSSNKKSWQENPNQGRTGVPLSEESRKRLSEKLMGHEVSDETKVRIGLAGLGREPWNKGLTKDTDDRLISVSEKIKEWNKQYMTVEMKKKISQTLKQKYKDGMKIPQAKGSFRTDLAHYFRSTWEANYARILNHESILWKYEAYSFPFYESNGDIAFTYIPDFFINDQEFIEVKGHADSETEWKCNCSRCERDKMKIAMFLQEYPDKKLRLIATKEYKELKAKYSKIVANWE